MANTGNDLDKLSTIEKTRHILSTKTAVRINGTLVDVFSASIIMRFRDSLSIERQTKFDQFSVARMASIAMSKMG
jgi:hypothetical protein